MQTLGFSDDEQETIFASLSAVLHLGNVNFKKNEGKGEGSVVTNKDGSLIHIFESYFFQLL
jgi:myosin heavy subunit